MVGISRTKALNPGAKLIKFPDEKINLGRIFLINFKEIIKEENR